MTEVEIPTYRDLMYPTLVAVEKLGGSAAISELEEEVPKIAGVTDEQMGVEFGPDSTLAGTSKIINRIHWARSYLQKIGALNNSTRGIWAITNEGNEFLAMDPDEADRALKEADNQVRAEMRMAKAEQLALRHSHAALLIAQGEHPKLIADRMGHASPTVTMSIYAHLFPGLDEEAAARMDSVRRTSDGLRGV